MVGRLGSFLGLAHSGRKKRKRMEDENEEVMEAQEAARMPSSYSELRNSLARSLAPRKKVQRREGANLSPTRAANMSAKHHAAGKSMAAKANAIHSTHSEGGDSARGIGRHGGQGTGGKDPWVAHAGFSATQEELTVKAEGEWKVCHALEVRGVR